MIETFNLKHLPPAHDDCTVNAYIYVENDENYNFSNHFRHNWTNRCESSYKKKRTTIYEPSKVSSTIVTLTTF